MGYPYPKLLQILPNPLNEVFHGASGAVKSHFTKHEMLQVDLALIKSLVFVAIPF